jgi:hypothetical protein
VADCLGERGCDRQVALARELVVEVAQIRRTRGVVGERVEWQRARVDGAQPRLDQDLDERTRRLIGQQLERLLALEAGDHALVEEARQALRPATELARVVGRARRQARRPVVAAQIVEEQAERAEPAGPRAGLDRVGGEVGEPVLEQPAGDVEGSPERPAGVLAELDEPPWGGCPGASWAC